MKALAFLILVGLFLLAATHLSQRYGLTERLLSLRDFGWTAHENDRDTVARSPTPKADGSPAPRSERTGLVTEPLDVNNESASDEDVRSALERLRDFHRIPEGTPNALPDDNPAGAGTALERVLYGGSIVESPAAEEEVAETGAGALDGILTGREIEEGDPQTW